MRTLNLGMQNPFSYPLQVKSPPKLIQQEPSRSPVIRCKSSKVEVGNTKKPDEITMCFTDVSNVDGRAVLSELSDVDVIVYRNEPSSRFDWSAALCFFLDPSRSGRCRLPLRRSITPHLSLPRLRPGNFHPRGQANRRHLHRFFLFQNQRKLILKMKNKSFRMRRRRPNCSGQLRRPHRRQNVLPLNPACSMCAFVVYAYFPC